MGGPKLTKLELEAVVIDSVAEALAHRLPDRYRTDPLVTAYGKLKEKLAHGDYRIPRDKRGNAA